MFHLTIQPNVWIKEYIFRDGHAFLVSRSLVPAFLEREHAGRQILYRNAGTRNTADRSASRDGHAFLVLRSRVPGIWGMRARGNANFIQERGNTEREQIGTLISRSCEEILIICRLYSTYLINKYNIFIICKVWMAIPPFSPPRATGKLTSQQ